MNKKTGYAFRIVLGGYLAYLGIRILIQMANERPNNMVLMSVVAVIFTVIGGAYAIYSLKKVWDLRKEEMTGTAEEAKEEMPGTDEGTEEEVTGTAEEAEEKPEENPKEKTEEQMTGTTKEEQEEEIENDYEEK